MAKPRCAICLPPLRAGVGSNSSASSTPLVCAMSARPPRWRCARLWFMGSLPRRLPEGCQGRRRTIAEMDALDQIGDTVIKSVAAYFGESHNPGIVRTLTRSHHPRCRKAEEQFGHRRQDRVFTGALEKMSATRPKQGRAARRQVSGSVSKKTDYVVAGPGAGSKLNEAKNTALRC